tara:strand:- start:258 stop:548 length:291 start_codon:yes stop_codon:yes gene_type:complete
MMTAIIAPLLNNNNIERIEDDKIISNIFRFKTLLIEKIRYIRTGSFMAIEKDEIFIFPVKPLKSSDLIKTFPLVITLSKITQLVRVVSRKIAVTVK